MAAPDPRARHAISRSVALSAPGATRLPPAAPAGVSLLALLQYQARQCQVEPDRCVDSVADASLANFHLAQLNIARAKAPLEDPLMAGFVGRLDEINALADASDGFVWRLQEDGGNATDVRPFEDERIIVNMSVWRDLDALRAYVYRSAHAELMRARRQWFEHMQEAYAVLWWVPAGHVPSVEEAKARLEALRANGPSPAAFTFQQTFPPP